MQQGKHRIFVSYKSVCFTNMILFTSSLWISNPMILILNYLCAHIFRNFLKRIIETTRECTLTKRNLVCSMIMISENATLKTILLMDPQCNCENQEYQDFHSIIIVICDTSIVSVNVGVLLKETFLS